MMRSYLKFCFVMSAAALIGMSAMSALAGELGLVDNGDMEQVNRFSPWGDPDDGTPDWAGSTPSGRPDAWHHSANSSAVWSDPNAGHPTTSGVRALWLEDPLLSEMAEFRSFAGDSACCGGDFPGVNTGNIPGVGNAGRSLDVGWNWNWDITSGTVFSGTVRISSVVGTGLDLSDGGDSNNITEYFFTTEPNTPSSNGYVSFSTNIPLDPAAAQFDIIFNTGERSLPNDTDPGRLDATGTMFVDDVFVNLIPEPASLLLLSIGGLMVMGRRRHG